MTHCILVKFISSFNLNNELENIKSIFNSIDIKGVHEIRYKLNCIKLDNRYDLLIEIDMNKDYLSLYNECSQHKEWKDRYTKYIDKKAIFDYE